MRSVAVVAPHVHQAPHQAPHLPLHLARARSLFHLSVARSLSRALSTCVCHACAHSRRPSCACSCACSLSAPPTHSLSISLARSRNRSPPTPTPASALLLLPPSDILCLPSASFLPPFCLPPSSPSLRVCAPAGWCGEGVQPRVLELRLDHCAHVRHHPCTPYMKCLHIRGAYRTGIGRRQGCIGGIHPGVLELRPVHCAHVRHHARKACAWASINGHVRATYSAQIDRLHMRDGLQAYMSLAYLAAIHVTCIPSSHTCHLHT